MYERSYGYKYQEVASGHAPDIAKHIRADIAQAVKEGLLPPKPVAYSVTSETFSGGQSIDVEVRNWPEAWTECDGRHCHNVWCAARNDPTYAHGATTHQVLTAEAQAAKMTLERIHGAYNHDGSEIQVDYFDVRYYGGVTFEDASSAAWREKERARLAARKAAREQAAATGETRRVMVYGSKGKRTVHLATEVDGHVRLLCGAQLWRGSLVDDAGEREVNCSRCAKRVQS